MKLEDQVCSLELAKRLKELGVKQESHFQWCENRHRTDVCVWLESDDSRTMHATGKYFAAFTVAELGEMLPHKIKDGEMLCGFWVNKFSGKHIWMVGYGSMKPALEFGASTEADARAKMLIHLIEKGIVKL